MKLNINQEQLKGIGNVGLKIGKAIVVEGTKTLVLKAAAATITQGFEEGFDSIKELKLDDLLKGKKQTEKKGLFGKTKKQKKFTKEELEELLKDLEQTKVTDEPKA